MPEETDAVSTQGRRRRTRYGRRRARGMICSILLASSGDGSALRGMEPDVCSSLPRIPTRRSSRRGRAPLPIPSATRQRLGLPCVCPPPPSQWSSSRGAGGSQSSRLSLFFLALVQIFDRTSSSFTSSSYPAFFPLVQVVALAAVRGHLCPGRNCSLVPPVFLWCLLFVFLTFCILTTRNPRAASKA